MNQFIFFANHNLKTIQMKPSQVFTYPSKYIELPLGNEFMNLTGWIQSLADFLENCFYYLPIALKNVFEK